MNTDLRCHQAINDVEQGKKMNSNSPSGQALSKSAIATAFLSCQEEVLGQWALRVTAEIPVAAKLGKPILTDSLPTLYNNIVEALTAGVPRSAATAGTNIAAAHGRERANMTEYGPHDLIHELQIFRDVLFSVTGARHLVLCKSDAEMIGRSIEQAARESISGYNAVNKEATEAFIESLSHDLRNPLHVVSASAQLLLLKTSDPAVINIGKRILRKIVEADAMIQTLLDAAVLRGQMKLRLDLSCFDIVLLIEEVCADIPLSGQQVNIEGRNIDGYWCRASMKRVLENLISNAQKYGDRSKAITVSVDQVDSRIFVAVHNEGSLISKADMARLFTSFRRIEDVNVKGWGLGLPYVQNVAESHGGSAIVDSGEGRGTTFTLSLPVDARPYVGNQTVGAGMLGCPPENTASTRDNRHQPEADVQQ
jgi:signal transduction histidine kinase